MCFFLGVGFVVVVVVAAVLPFSLLWYMHPVSPCSALTLPCGVRSSKVVAIGMFWKIFIVGRACLFLSVAVCPGRSLTFFSHFTTTGKGFCAHLPLPGSYSVAKRKSNKFFC